MQRGPPHGVGRDRLARLPWRDGSEFEATAVDVQVRTGDEARLGRSEEQHRACHFFGLAHTFHRYGPAQAGTHRFDLRETGAALEDLGLRGTGRNDVDADPSRQQFRSEEHTSELQSQSNLVCRLLLEKKKKYNNSSIADSVGV